MAVASTVEKATVCNFRASDGTMGLGQGMLASLWEGEPLAREATF